MPAWWGKKSTKNKEESPQNQSPRGTNIGLIKFSPRASKAARTLALVVVVDHPGFRVSIRIQWKKRGIPLPRPYVSSIQGDYLSGWDVGRIRFLVLALPAHPKIIRLRMIRFNSLPTGFFFFPFIYTYIGF